MMRSGEEAGAACDDHLDHVVLGEPVEDRGIDTTLPEKPREGDAGWAHPDDQHIRVERCLR
jgi:hypothetical protein